jgi:hypothetical protein
MLRLKHDMSISCCVTDPGRQEQPALATSMTNVARMRMRAAANVSFVYVKIPPVQACISYKACAQRKPLEVNKTSSRESNMKGGHNVGPDGVHGHL